MPEFPNGDYRYDPYAHDDEIRQKEEADRENEEAQRAAEEEEARMQKEEEMTQQVSSATSSTPVSVSADSLGDGGITSLHLMFAKLELALSEAARKNAMTYMESITSQQDEQKKVAAFLQEARQRQASGGAVSVPADMSKYLNDNHLARTSGSGSNEKDDWAVIVPSLQARSETLGTDTQQKMVFVQDYMGQYNSFLQGANSAIQSSNDLLKQLAQMR